MSELDLCSRREADRLILNGCVKVDGKLVEVGEKVSSSLKVNRIEILKNNSVAAEFTQQQQLQLQQTDNSIVAVVLNKPVGYVSGQAEHGYDPAIQLLTPTNLWKETSSLTTPTKESSTKFPTSWKGFAPAGRLDRDSTGLLVFSKSGVIAKKLIGENSSVEKEYTVHVSPANQPSRREIEIDPYFKLPKSTYDLTRLLKGGGTLLEPKGRKTSPLKPCADARWIEKGEILNIVLTEGRKHQIRRACRELLGWHVNALQRIRIGPINMGNLPEGSWRPLRQDEIDNLMAS
jgi:23S rRNA pseudouridine2604 synthase